MTRLFESSHVAGEGHGIHPECFCLFVSFSLFIPFLFLTCTVNHTVPAKFVTGKLRFCEGGKALAEVGQRK